MVNLCISCIGLLSTLKHHTHEYFIVGEGTELEYDDVSAKNIRA
jgi:hypothetical protein